MKCATCQFENPPGFKFCGGCGGALGAAAPATAAPAPAPATPARTLVNVRAPDGTIEAVAPRADERRTVTILFADISGFTAMSEKLDPEVVQEIMDRAFERLTAVITGFGGTIDKYIGDAIMALFGAPVALGDDPERAVRAGLGMQRVMVEYSEELKRARGFPLAMRVGVNTGKVIWGRVGGAGEKTFTVMGDAVNLASRLEHAAPLGGVLIGESTSRHVRTAFSLEALEPIQVKGKAELQRTYRVIGEVSGAARATLVGPRTPFVGRDDEMAEIVAALEAVKNGAIGSVITLEAPPGTGKSRMVLEIRHEAEDRSVTTLAARSAAFGQGSPFAPWSDLLQRAAAIGNLSAPAARDRLKTWLDETAPGAEIDARWFHELANVVDVSDPEVQRRREQPAQFRKGVQEAIASWLESATKQSPVLLLAEDLHWWPAPALELLLAVSAVSTKAPFLILATRRSDPLPVAWPPRETDRVLQLQPLDHAALHSLTRGVLGHEVPPGLLARLENISEGNPFFAEELLQAYIDRGALHTSADRAGWIWDETIAERLDLPTTVEGVTQARIDSLPNREKHILQMAAVAGRTFWEGLLTTMGEPGVGEALLQLIARDLIHARRSRLAGEKEYAFKHATIQSVAYENHLKRERIVDHRRVAEWLEARVGKDSIEFAPVIAEHFLRAEEKTRALPHLLLGAEEEVRASVKLENAQMVERCAVVAEEVGDASAQTRAFRYRGRIRRIAGDSRAESDLRRAMEIGQGIGNELAVAEAGVELAGALYSRAAAQEANETAQMTLLAARLAKSTRCEVLALNMLGILSRASGDDLSATRFYTAALETARRANDLWNANFILGSLCSFFFQTGKFEDSLKSFQQVDRDSLTRENLARLRSNAGAALLALGDLAAAQVEFDEALRSADEIGLVEVAAEARIRKGALLTRTARSEDALGWINDGLEIARSRGLADPLLEGLMSRAGFRGASPEDVRRDLSEAREIATRGAKRAVLARIDAALAKLSQEL